MPLGRRDLEGKAIFQGISLVRTRDFPLVEPPTKPTFTLKPAELKWRETLDKTATLEKRRRRLGATRPQAKAEVMTRIFADLPGVGPREIIFEVDEATPGFGILLGRRNKDELADNVRFILDKDNRLSLQMQGYPGDQVVVETDSLNQPHGAFHAAALLGQTPVRLRSAPLVAKPRRRPLGLRRPSRRMGARQYHVARHFDFEARSARRRRLEERDGA